MIERGPGQPRDRGRRRAQGRLAEPDGPAASRAPTRLDFAGFHAYYEDLITKTRENKLTADDFQGTNITLTNPGGLGTVASVPRLMTGQGTIIATGSIAYPVEWAHAPAEKIKALGVSKVMTMTSTYDHRIIQGAESGSFLRRIDQLLQGEDEFYESVAESLGIPANVVTNAYPASASAPPLVAAGAAPAPRPRPHRRTPSCCRRSRPRPRCSRPTAPTATSRPASTRSAASRRATRRSSPRTST